MAVTFAVSDVKPVPLSDWEKRHYTPKPLMEVLRKQLGASEGVRIGHESHGPDPKIEAFGGPTEIMPTIDGPKQGFFDAVHLAYNRHLPLVLSPDHLWLTIAQGFARHVSLNAKELYPQLVHPQFIEDKGDTALAVRRDEFVKGKSTNDWVGVFEEFSQQIRARTVPKTYERLICDFSTTGVLEKAVSNLTLMDTMSSYFTYEVHTLCGIPKIVLEGTSEDWRKLRAKASMLAEYGLGWWTEKLLPVLDRFVSAIEGDINVSWWQELYKVLGGSGGPRFSGHIATLFPYLKFRNYDHKTETTTDEYVGRNRIAVESKAAQAAQGASIRPPTDPWRTTSTASIPSGFVTVPFVWRFVDRTFNMQFIGGLVGVTQDATGVSPTPVWTVCNDSK